MALLFHSLTDRKDQFESIVKTISIYLFFAFTPAISLAQFAGGSGTEADPYQVATPQQLDSVRHYLDAHFIQTADIDLDVAPYNVYGEVAPYTIATGWHPIGNNGAPFTGVYDGGNFKIQNLVIWNPIDQFLGLFGVTNSDSTEIRNLHLRDIQISFGPWMGGIAGKASNTRISNSSVTSVFTRGENFNTVASGGLVGEGRNLDIENCFFEGEIEGSYDVGGLIALSIQTTISESYANASISIDNEQGTVGGLVGSATPNGSYVIVIDNSYSRGEITAPLNNELVGGIIGAHDINGMGSIINSYSAMSITPSEPGDGGLSDGVNDPSYPEFATAVENSFWDVEVSGHSVSHGGTGKITAEMKSEATFANAGWDLTNTWEIKSEANDGYPYLKETKGTINVLPVASNLEIAGKPAFPFALSAEYEYNDDENEQESGTTIKWYLSDDSSGTNKTQIGGAIGIDYAVAKSDSAKYLSFSVTPANESGTGFEIESNRVGPVWIVFEGGWGNEEDPYQVDTPSQLDSVRNYLDAHFIQTADIDLNISPYNLDTGWHPVGGQNAPFTGLYDGNGFIIDNLMINRTEASNMGLFGLINTADLLRVQIKNANIDVTQFGGGIGLLAGQAQSSQILECSAEGEVTTSVDFGGDTGGIVGFLSDNSLIKASNFKGAVTGGSKVGGLAGKMYDSEILGSFAEGKVSAINHAGGLVGYSLRNTISESYSSADITSLSENSGGLVGGLLNSQLSDSYLKSTSLQDKTVIYNLNSDAVSGLVGRMSSSTITNSYFMYAEMLGNPVNGIAGERDVNSAITSGFWDNEITPSLDANGGTGLTTAEMQSISTYLDAGWQFGETWMIRPDVNNGYPELKRFYTDSNSIPEVSDALIQTYDFKVDELITGIYTFLDKDADTENGSLIQWYRAEDTQGSNNVTITGATDTTYTIQSADLGLYLAMQIIPFDGVNYGDTVRTNWYGPVVDISHDEHFLIVGDDGGGVTVAEGPDLAGTSFTASFWVKMDSIHARGYALGGGASHTPYESWYAGFDPETNLFAFGFYGDELTTGELSTDTLWHHWAVTYNASTNQRNIYMDGQLMASDLAGGSYQGTDSMSIGAWNGQYIKGALDEVQIWDTALSQEDIRSRMFNALGGNEDGLVAYWPFTDGLWSKTITDFSENNRDGQVLTGSRLKNTNVRPQGTFLSGNEGWRLITAPTEGTTYADLLDGIWTQGYPGADSEEGEPNVFWYDEATRSWNAPSDASNLIGSGVNEGMSTAGKGILVYAFDDDNADGSANPWPKMLTVDGRYAVENHQLSLSRTVTDPDDGKQGWHIVGNPYPFSIHWLDLGNNDALEDIIPVIFVYDHSMNNGLGGYRVNYGMEIPDMPSTIGHDGVIEPFQAFWVRTTGNSDTGSISFSELYRAVDIGTLYAKPTASAPDTLNSGFISLLVESGDFGESALLSFTEDQEMIAERPAPFNVPPIEFGFISKENQLLAMENLNPESIETEYPVYFTSSINGPFKLSMYGQESWPAAYSVKINDLQTNEVHDLTNGNSFLFENKASLGKAKVRENPTVQFQQLQTTKGVHREPRFTLSIVKESLGEGENMGMPNAFALSQNYPNPFNPSTVINYQLPENSKVELRVFDMLGREVAVLVNRQIEAGYHSVTFDAKHLASGVYIYRLQAGDKIFTKKLTLIK